MAMSCRCTHQDEVRSHIGCTGNKVLVRAPQVSQVVCLQDQDDDPVDARDNGTQAEPSWSVVVLSPDGVTVGMMLAIDRTLECIVGSDDDQQKPGHNGEDLVGDEVLAGEIFPFRKGVICKRNNHSISTKQDQGCR